MYTTAAVLAGVLLDFLFGDPHGIVHPVVLIGRLISWLEGILRRRFPDTPRGKRTAGFFLWVMVMLMSAGVPSLVLWAAWRIHPAVWFAVSSVMCYQIMAAKSLRDESMKVYGALERQDLPAARESVSMIVGRDTDRLDRAGVIKATVETVAENTSDGCIAPLFFMAVGGAPLGFAYKAVNTMDSMIGYKNERYVDFGRFAARMDDLWNYVPARLAAALFLVSAFLCGQDAGRALRVYWRDRRRSPSPNAAQTESVCAGALGVTLLGDAWYFGQLHHKQTIGDDVRPVNAEDIRTVNRMMYVSVLLGTIVFLAVRCAVLCAG